MKRITITLSDEIAADLDQYMGDSGAKNRSEAIRDLVRRAMLDRHDGPDDADCLGIVSYTVDQTKRNLGARLAKRRLDAHDRHLTSLSVPLDHSTALEIEVTQGKLGDIASAAETLFLERGVAHGALSLVPISANGKHHVHEDEEEASPHRHIHVQQAFQKSQQGKQQQGIQR